MNVISRGAESWWGCSDSGSDSGFLIDSDSDSSLVATTPGDSDSDSGSDSAPLLIAIAGRQSIILHRNKAISGRNRA